MPRFRGAAERSKAFTLSGKLGRDTPLTAEICAAARRQARDVIYLQTNDAGAFFRFTDTYSKMVGGQLALAMDPPTAEPSAKEGLINVRDFSVKGEAALDRLAAGGPAGAQSRHRVLARCARNSPGRTDSSPFARAS